MPKAAAWQREVIAEVVGTPLKPGTRLLYNPFGRRGLFYGPDAGTRSVAFNPQSTAADIIYRAMLGLLYEAIGWPRSKAEEVVHVLCPLPPPARIIAQIHDQLLGECPRDILPDVCHALKTVMTQPWPELKSELTPDGLSIPIALEVGESWGEMEPWAG